MKANLYKDIEYQAGSIIAKTKSLKTFIIDKLLKNNTFLQFKDAGVDFRMV